MKSLGFLCLLLGLGVIIRPGVFVSSELPVSTVSEQVDVVFIGNSMLENRITESALQAHWPDKSIKIVFQRGTGSTHWYFFLKHRVLKFGLQPSDVFIFFTGDSLTRPDLPLFSANYYRREFSHVIDAEDQGLLSQNFVTPGIVGQVSAAAHQVFPLLSYRDSIRRYGDGFLMNLIAAPKEVREQIDARFAPERLNLGSPEDDFQKMLPSHQFEESLQASFLPAMLKLANDYDFRLHLLRMKTAAPNSKEVEAYIVQLQNYARSRGAYFHDFSKLSEIDSSFFSTELYIKPELQSRYAEIFVNSVGDQLR